MTRSAAPQWIAKKQSEVSQFFRVSLPTVQMWAKQGMPGKSGRYHLDEILAWLRTGAWATKQKSESDERLQAIKLELAELELLEKKRSLICVADAIDAFSDCGHRIRAALQGVETNHVALTRLLDAIGDCQRMIRDLGNANNNHAS